MKLKCDKDLKVKIEKCFNSYLLLNYKICINEKHKKLINKWFLHNKNKNMLFNNFDYAFYDFLDYFKRNVFYEMGIEI